MVCAAVVSACLALSMQTWAPNEWSRRPWFREQQFVHPCRDSAQQHRTPRRQPGLLLFQHVPKTGGTSVSSFLRQAASDGVLDLLVPMGAARCFLYQTFGPVFGVANASGCAGWRPGACTNASLGCCDLPDWRVSTIAVEFHVQSSTTLFFTRVLPAIGKLSHAYTELGGTCLTATLLREPIAYLLSAFMYHPPCEWQGARARMAASCRLDALLERFPAWAAQFWGGQIGRLLVRPGGRELWVEEAGARGWLMRYPGSCEDALAGARRVVASIDLVAPTECLAEFLASVDARLRLNLTTPRGAARGSHGVAMLEGVQRVLRHVPHVKPGYSQLTSLDAALREQLTWAKLNSTTRTLIKNVTSCDRALYEDVLRRSTNSLAMQCKLLPSLVTAARRALPVDPTPAAAHTKQARDARGGR